MCVCDVVCVVDRVCFVCSVCRLVVTDCVMMDWLVLLCVKVFVCVCYVFA